MILSRSQKVMVTVMEPRLCNLHAFPHFYLPSHRKVIVERTKKNSSRSVMVFYGARYSLEVVTVSCLFTIGTPSGDLIKP